MITMTIREVCEQASNVDRSTVGTRYIAGAGSRCQRLGDGAIKALDRTVTSWTPAADDSEWLSADQRTTGEGHEFTFIGRHASSESKDLLRGCGL